MLYRILLFSIKPQHESAIGIHISSPFWNFPPSPSPSHASKLIQSPCLSFLRHGKFLLAIYFTYGNVSFHPLLPSPHVHKSILYVCFSIAALQINSSVPSFWIMYIHVSIQHLSFTFWLTSLCIIDFSFIHLIRTDANAFLFMAE